MDNIEITGSARQRRSSWTPGGVVKYLGLQLLQRGAIRILSSPTVMAFSAGVALGAGGGLLFAPRSGKETRERIGRWIKKVAGGTEDKVGDVIEAVEAGVRDAANVTTRKPSDHYPSSGPRMGGGETTP